MRLPPPDPLSTILLYVSAVVMALKEALAPGSVIAAQVPSLTMTGVWSYVPSILLAIAFVIWISRGARSSAPPPPPMPQAESEGALHHSPSPRRSILPAHEPLSSDQIHHLLYFGIFFLAMVAMSGLSRCDSESSRASVEAAAAAAKK